MRQYIPNVPPQLDEELLPYLSEEFHRVSENLNGVLTGQWEIEQNLPIRLKPGWVGYLAGIPANPLDPQSTGSDPLGTGQEGLYRYSTTGWVYIG